MKILVVGGGAREHALAWKLSRERDVTAVLCAPGNPGIAVVARCVPADVGEPARAAGDRRSARRVDLTVVGPELPLSRGVVDVFTADGPRDRRSDPGRGRARIEQGVREGLHGAPSRADRARFASAIRPTTALDGDRRGEFGYPLVLKADGLAAGKGVVIAEDRAAAEAADSRQ